MLQVIDWLEYYQEQMRVFGYDESTLKSMARFPVIAEDLLRFESQCCPALWLKCVATCMAQMQKVDRILISSNIFILVLLEIS